MAARETLTDSFSSIELRPGGEPYKCVAGRGSYMHVGRAVIRQLAANGIDTLFGIPGTQTLPLNEAVAEHDEMRFVTARHETAVSHQAWGYAEASGEPAATLVIPGPGDMNAMNGLKNALNDCTPLVHLAVETSPEIRGGEGIHETPPDTYDTVLKANVLVSRPGSAVAELQRAIATATTPPRGPVRVGIPKNFLTRDVPLADPGTYSREAVTDVSEDAMERAADVLADASRPAVLVGGGVRAAEAGPELRRVARQLNAPLLTTVKGKGVVPDSHELVAGTLGISASPELRACLDSSDALLAVGTDFDAVWTRTWSAPVPEDLVHVTLSSADVGRGYDPTVSIVADAGEALESLSATLSGRAVDGDGAERAAAVAAADRERIEPLLGGDPPVTSVRALRAVREATPREAVVTADAGGSRLWALHSFDAAGPRCYINPGSWATMGTALPSAIGAQLADPDAPVVALVGDGGLLMCLHELHTAVSADAPVTVVAFDNRDYAIISEEAGRSFDLPAGAYSWDGAPIEFTTVAEGLGMRALHAETPDEIREAVATAVAADEPVLVEVPTDPHEPQVSQFMSESGGYTDRRKP